MESGAFASALGEGTAASFRPSPELVRYVGRMSEIRDGPMPGVLDTSCVYTGLQYQLANGRLPASIQAATDETIRLFMELETLRETLTKLPLFAEQLRVPVEDLQRIFADEWMPLIWVVDLPPELRELDQRALQVSALDPDDYATAALAALLSPCILLTRNHRHFWPLGVRTPSQGVDAVFAAINVEVGQVQFQALAMIPTAPVVAVGATVKLGWDKIGPAALLILAAVVAGGVMWYRRQPDERRERIRSVVGEVGQFLAEEGNKALTEMRQAEALLGAYVVPEPEICSVTSAVVRKLAMTEDSMSAQQICDTLDDPVRPSVPRLRTFLHANKQTVFRELRNGSFALGRTYTIRKPAAVV